MIIMISYNILTSLLDHFREYFSKKNKKTKERRKEVVLKTTANKKVEILENSPSLSIKKR